MKICETCKRELSDELFPPDRRCKSGFSYNCMDCRKKTASKGGKQSTRSKRHRERMRHVNAREGISQKSRTCKKCDRHLEASEFAISLTRAGGRHAYCRDCNFKCSRKYTPKEEYKEGARKRSKERYERRRSFVDAVREEHGCMNPACRWGGDYLPEMIDFHHKNPEEKEFAISAFGNYHRDKILREIKKCQLVCKHCHILIHNDRLDLSSVETCNPSDELFELHFAPEMSA